MKWIDADSEVKPYSDRPIICYCPAWSNCGYQIGQWKDGVFRYDEDPNGSFNDFVDAWASFLEFE